MSTFAKQAPRLATGRYGCVHGSAEWIEEAKQLTPTSDVEDATARVRKLASDGLDVMKNLNFCTFPMKKRKGLFEIRKNGVRFYGGRLRGGVGQEVLVLLGAEQKAGKREASDRLLDQCEDRLVKLKKVFEEEQAKAVAVEGGRTPGGDRR